MRSGRQVSTPVNNHCSVCQTSLLYDRILCQGRRNVTSGTLVKHNVTMITPNPGDDLRCPCMGLEIPLGRFHCKTIGFEHTPSIVYVNHKVFNIFLIADHRFACDSLAAACDSLTAASQSSCADVKSTITATTNPWHRASACDSLAAAVQSSCDDFHLRRVPERLASWHQASACDSLAAARQSSRGDFQSM